MKKYEKISYEIKVIIENITDKIDKIPFSQ